MSIIYIVVLLKRHLRETQRNFQRRIQEREKELQEVREAVESHKGSLEQF